MPNSGKSMQTAGLEIINAPLLARLTNIRLGGTAVAGVRVESEAGFEKLPELLQSLGGRPMVLGRGSNIIARGGELPLTLIGLGGVYQEADIQVLEDYDDRVLIRVPGGMRLPVLVSRTAKNGWAGLTGLVGVPGSVGGAVAGNAGSFGMDIKGCLHSLTAFSPQCGLVRKEASEVEISYRHFAIPDITDQGWYLVTGAEFMLRKADAAALQAEMEGFHRVKVNTQPVKALSAGCVFKNHERGPAGKLLQEAGLKGRTLGGMVFSEIHANFLVNTGQGTSEQAFELIDTAARQVEERFGARLELEVRIWA